jgi:2-iminobutanoate/2-iminopropanoate deaminase
VTSLVREIVEPRNPALDVSKSMNLPHSPGVRAGDFIFLSGMVAVDPSTGERSPGTVVSETRQILENMTHLLESAGSSLQRILKLNVLLYDMLELDNVNRVFREFFPDDPPARTVCGVQLGFGLKVEIECIALAGES